MYYLEVGYMNIENEGTYDQLCLDIVKNQEWGYFNVLLDRLGDYLGGGSQYKDLPNDRHAEKHIVDYLGGQYIVLYNRDFYIAVYEIKNI